jgi:hypothetical protein
VPEPWELPDLRREPEAQIPGQTPKGGRRMKPIKIESNPYTEIANIIEEWCKKNFYDSFVVTISRDGQIITEYLELDGMSLDFIWENDWYDGEKDISLIGFMPMLQLRVYGAGETNYDKLRAMNPEALADQFTKNGDGVFLCPVHNPNCLVADCRECFLGWLRQEAPHDQP